MGFYNENTSNILGKIATLKTIIEKSSTKRNIIISQAENLIDSVMEIFRQIGGYGDMLGVIETILSEKINDIEEAIKSAIKIAIKQIISCGIEPTISDYLIYTGVTFSISEIDPNSTLTIDPLSESGSYVYFDNKSGTYSRDFNVFLYTLIRNTINNQNYIGDNWYKIESDGNEQISVPLLRMSYNEFQNETPNVLTVKIHERFSGEKLSFFISEYLDSIKLFNNVQILSLIFDEILNTKIIKTKKNQDQLIVEDIVSSIVDRILNGLDDDNEVIDDSYYQFSNEEYNDIINASEKKKNSKYTYSTDIEIQINEEDLLYYFQDLKKDDLLITQQTSVLSNTIDQIVNDIVSNDKIAEKEKYNIKTNIVNNIIKKLIITITNNIFSPKVLYIFILANEILQTKNETNVIDFIKSNINLYKTIILKTRDLIIDELILKLKKMLSPMIKQVITELTNEKFILYKKQIESIRNAINTIT